MKIISIIFVLLFSSLIPITISAPTPRPTRKPTPDPDAKTYCYTAPMEEKLPTFRRYDNSCHEEDYPNEIDCPIGFTLHQNYKKEGSRLGIESKYGIRICTSQKVCCI